MNRPDCACTLKGGQHDPECEHYARLDTLLGVPTDPNGAKVESDPEEDPNGEDEGD